MQFAQRIDRLAASPIREILHILDRPGMISFAGGLPASESFPEIKLDKIPSSALQYGASEGDTALRQCIAADLEDIGLCVESDQVFILSGSQQGIDLVAKLFVEPGAPIAVESPTYLAALQVFRLFGAEITSFSPADFSSLRRTTRKPRMLYVNPTFQNPTGYCYDLAQRHGLAAICDEQDIVLFEDDPYRDLVYEACDRQPIVSLLKKSHWVYQSSFSKSFAPGLRLGYLVCSKPLAKYFSRLKQAADLHSNRLSQYLIQQQYFAADRSARLANLQNLYRRKRDLFEHYLVKHLGDYASWSRPSGGLFYWLKLKANMTVDTQELLTAAIEKGIAFMPGEPFFTEQENAANQLRLNFSLANEDQTDHGLMRLRQCLDEYYNNVERKRLTANG